MAFAAGFLGLILGVGVNLFADSLPYTRTVSPPHCGSCGKERPPLAWSGLLGLISGQRKCEYCGTPRPLRAAIVELVLCVAEVMLSLATSSLGVFLIQSAILSLYVLIAVIDIEHRLILHIVSAPTALLIGLIGILDPAKGLQKTLLGGVAGFGIFLLLYFFGGVFAALMARLRGTQIDEVAFGFGDVTLAGVIGLTVGWPGVLVALVLGILAAGGFSLLFMLSMLLRRKYNPFVPIPYGPFLILGTLFVYFGGVGFIANSL